MRFTVEAAVIKLGSVYFAMGDVQGIRIRGGSRSSPAEAIASFFQVLGGASGNSDDSLIACALLAAGTDIGTAIADAPQIGDGK